MEKKREERESATVTTAVFGSKEMLQSAPVDKIPEKSTTAEIAYRIVQQETPPA